MIDFFFKYNLITLSVKRFNFFVLVLILLCIWFIPVYSSSSFLYSDDTPDAQIDQKQLDKAETLKQEADLLILSATDMYLQSSALQQDPDYYSNKKKQSQSENLEKKALDNELKASDLYFESNTIMYSEYQDQMELFWRDNPDKQNQLTNSKLLEEEAGSNIYQANEIRKLARVIKEGKDRYYKLTEANELELQAINKLKLAYAGVTEDNTYDYTQPVENLYAQNEYSNQPSATSTEQNTFELGRIISSAPTGVDVNAEQVLMFQNYLNNYSSIYGDTVALSEKISGYDTDALAAFWAAYLNGSFPQYSETSGGQDDAIATDMAATQTLDENQNMNANGTSEEYAMQVQGEVTGQDAENTIYRVQITANRTPLEQNMLRKIYYGNHQVGMIQEEGWFKYSIGDFTTFKEAAAFKQQTGMPNAFVVAVKKGKTYQYVDLGTTGSIETSQPGLYFAVQIAACKNQSTTPALEKLYNGGIPIDTHNEDGWYKYTVGKTGTFQEARDLLKQINCPGTFIVAYKDGIRISLIQAKGMVDHNALIFYVQIAASKLPLPASELKRLNQENKNVREISENGWYKYQIAAGNTYSGALRVRNEIEVRGAFIVAYKGSIKLNITQAIQEQNK